MADKELDEFLKSLTPETIYDVRWGGGIRLRVACYLDETFPPDSYITSVRAILFTAEGVAVLQNADGRHIVPGGRRKAGEPLLDTLRREVLEETGCSVDEQRLLGFLHLRHLTPKPEGYPYPYPDFFQVVYAAKGRIVTRDFSDPDGYEECVEFVAVDRLDTSDLGEDERCFFCKALTIPEIRH